MDKHSNFTALSFIKDELKKKDSLKLAMVVSEDLGPGLSILHLRNMQLGAGEIIEVDCNLDSANFQFSPVREFIRNMNELRHMGLSDFTITEFISKLSEGEEISDIVIFKNVQNVSTNEFDRLIYLIDRLRKSKITVIVSYRSVPEPLLNRDEFINSIRHVVDQVSEVSPVTQDQFEYLMKNLGYRLPNEFMSQLFRFSNRSIDLFRYAMSYYRANGLILGNNKVDEKMYRGFPIPPPVESHYRNVFRSLDPLSRSIAYVVSLSGKALLSEVGEVVAENEATVTEAAELLRTHGFITFQQRYLQLAMSRFSRIISEMFTDDEKSRTESRIMETGYFENLPVNLRISIMCRRGDFDVAKAMLKKNTGEIAYELRNTGQIEDFVSRLRRSVLDDDFDMMLSELLCEGYNQYGPEDDAIQCYSQLREYSELAASATLKTVDIHLRKGDFQSAETVLATSGLHETEDRVQLASYYIALSRVQLENGNIDDAKDNASRALDIADEFGENLLTAEATCILGEICVTSRKYEDAFDRFTEALELCRESPDSGLQLRITSSIAVVNTKLGKYREAIGQLHEVLKKTYYTGDRRKRAYDYFNILKAYEIVGDHNAFNDVLPVASSSIEFVDGDPLQYEFHRLLTFHYHISAEYGKAVAEAKVALLTATRFRNEQWKEMARGMLSVTSSFLDGNARNENWDLLSKHYSIPEDVMPFYLTSSLTYFILIGEFGKFSETLEALHSYCELSNDFFGNAMYEISEVSLVLYNGNFDLFREAVSRLDGRYDSVGIYSAFRKVFSIISHFSDYASDDFNEEFRKLEEDIETVYPRSFKISAMAFRALLEVKLNGTSQYLHEKLSKEKHFSILTERILRETVPDGQ